MPGKSKSSKKSGATDPRSLPVAQMKFWSRLKTSAPAAAFSVGDFDDDLDDDVELLELIRLSELPDDKNLAFSLKISLMNSRPAVWRRVHVKSMNLSKLHDVIQIAVGWDDMHLHEYAIGKHRVPLVDDRREIDERDLTLAQLHAAKLKEFVYTYDLGDEWDHRIQIERPVTLRANVVYPRCMGGNGSCPLEDVGGTHFWNRLQQALKHPDRDYGPDVEDWLDLFGRKFQPVPFDLDATNANLEKAFHKPKRRRKQA